MPEATHLIDKINSSKKILVTGSAGLLGNNLIHQLLDEGNLVTAIYNNAPVNISHTYLTTVQCDILDTNHLEEIMNDVTNVYHCAALVSYEPKDKYKLLKINAEGTANIVNACLNAGIEKLMYVSSVAALGRTKNSEIINESTNRVEEEGKSNYGKSKYLGEMEVWRGIGEGLNAVIVNPSVILGGNNWNNSSGKLFKNVYNEFKWYSEGVNGFVDVRDVSRAMILLMNSEITAERFILSSENLSYKEIFYWMAQCFYKNPPSKKVSPFMAEVIWRLEALQSFFSGKKKLVTKETAHTAMSNVFFDNSKILKALPEFSFTPIKNSIEYTCEILKQAYHLK